jgi:hypothetical protein
MDLRSNREPSRHHGRRSVRCADVARELAVPTGDVDGSVLAEHLASCPRCAALSAQAERLHEVWEITRPHQPTGGFDALWARVRRALDTPQRTLSFSEARPHRRRWMIAAAGLAQAAVLLVAVFVLFPRGGGQAPNEERNANTTIAQAAPAPVTKPSDLPETPLPRIDIDEGQFMVIRMNDQRVILVSLSSPEPSNRVADDFVMLNDMESMAPVAQ